MIIIIENLFTKHRSTTSFKLTQN